MYKTIDIGKSRNIAIDKLLTIDVLHDAYHRLASSLAKKSNCKLYIVDASLSTRLHYMSPHRDKMKAFFQALLEEDYHFSIKYKNKKEIFYITESFSLEGIDYDSISALKIYVRVYSKSTNFMIFASRVALVIDFWREVEETYRANIFNTVVTILPIKTFKKNVTSVLLEGNDIPALSAYKSLYEKLKKDPIDIVYTWVDTDDTQWLKKKNSMNDTGYDPTALCDARYTNNNELMYSLRSVLTYFKDINKIYIVTDNQIPDFLVLPNDKISIIDHKDIFSNLKNLPSYNSNAIESQLHHMKGLSQKYLYFNDDVFVGRAITRTLFFDEYNHAKCFYSTAVSIPPTNTTKVYSPVDNAAINNRNLLEKSFGVSVSRKFKHTPVPVLKNIMDELENLFPDVFDKTASHPFRSNEDYSIAGALYYHYGLISGHVASSDLLYTYIGLGAEGFSTKLKKILKKKESKRYDILCINSVEIDETYESCVAYFNEVFSIYYPCAGEWERKKVIPTSKVVKKKSLESKTTKKETITQLQKSINESMIKSKVSEPRMTFDEIKEVIVSQLLDADIKEDAIADIMLQNKKMNRDYDEDEHADQVILNHKIAAVIEIVSADKEYIEDKKISTKAHKKIKKVLRSKH